MDPYLDPTKTTRIWSLNVTRLNSSNLQCVLGLDPGHHPLLSLYCFKTSFSIQYTLHRAKLRTLVRAVDPFIPQIRFQIIFSAWNRKRYFFTFGPVLRIRILKKIRKQKEIYENQAIFDVKILTFLHTIHNKYHCNF